MLNLGLLRGVLFSPITQSHPETNTGQMPTKTHFIKASTEMTRTVTVIKLKKKLRPRQHSREEPQGARS